MPKDIPVSNGNLLFNFDSDYRVRDVYFPLIGQENHSKGHPFRFGIWADGSFSWMGPEWSKDLRYQDDSLVTDVFLKDDILCLELRCRDAVDFDLDIYIREVEVTNLAAKDRHVRLFFTHDFHLYGYKASRYFLINCCEGGKSGVDHYACEVKDLDEAAGSWKDAEDGELNGNPIAWGSADSTIGIRLHLPPGGRATGFYWVAAGTRYHEVSQLNQAILEKTPTELITRTSNYWAA
jgi:GH15 family glucan-1,4-alpha-glucosidase